MESGYNLLGDGSLLPVRLEADHFHKYPNRLRRLTWNRLWSNARVSMRRWKATRSFDAMGQTWPKAPQSGSDNVTFDILVGPLSDRSGLGRAARYEASFQAGQKKDILIVDSLAASEQETRRIIAQRISHRNPRILVLGQPDSYERSFSLLGREILESSHRTGSVVWEMPYFPREWRFLNNVLHECWTPSEYSASGLRQGLQIPLFVRPYHIHEDQQPQNRTPPSRKGTDIFRGLAVMDLRSCPDRKNPWAHIEAWQRAFGNNPAFELTIKVQFTKRTKIVRSELSEMIRGYNNIHLMEAALSDLEMSKLYAQANVFISLHRAEGYGLGIAEALSVGIPAIATDWSAPAEYMNDNLSQKVKYRLITYSDFTNSYPGARGLKWADADVYDAAKKLRAVASTWKAFPAATRNIPVSELGS